MSYGAREPTTAMEWRQEQTEAMYADEDRWLHGEIAAERFVEAPMDKREKLLRKIDSLTATLRELPEQAMAGIVVVEVESWSTVVNGTYSPTLHLTREAIAMLRNPCTLSAVRATDQMDYRYFTNAHGVVVFTMEDRT